MRQLPDQAQPVVSRYLRTMDATLPAWSSGCTWDAAITRRAEATDFVTFAINATRDDADR
jgi:hypothetical protein